MGFIRALATYHLTGKTTFHPSRNTFLQVDASGGDVTVYLQRQSQCEPGDWYIVKKIDGSAHTITVYGNDGDLMNNGTSGNVLSGQNQGHKYQPVAAPSYGPGWVSF